jgi:hypothetical protein
MNKFELIESMAENHNRFANYMNILTEEEYLFAMPEKWSAGQQLDHLVRSTNPLILAVRLPHFILPLIFGKANRPSKSYHELVEKYLQKINNGGKATGNYIPPQVGFDKKEKLIQQLNSNVAKINKGLNQFSEQELDECILPHPLLGKLTFREMIYFTIYHVDHHHFIIDKALQQNLETTKEDHPLN